MLLLYIVTMLLLYIVTMVIGVTTATSSYSGYYIKVFDVLKLSMIIVVMTTDLAVRIKRNVVTLVRLSTSSWIM